VDSSHRFGPFRLDTRSRVLTRDGTVVPLAPRTLDLLLVFVTSGGRLLTKDELLRTIWGDVHVEEASLAFQVSTLRKALGEHGPAWIETVPKHGYRFTAAVLTEPADVLVARTAVAGTGSETVLPAAPARLQDPARRIRDMGEAKLARTRPVSPRMAVALTTGAVLILATAAWGAWLRHSPTVADVASGGHTMLMPVTADAGGLSCDPALSPDGKLLAYASDRSGEGNLDIWVQQVGGGEPVRVTRHAADDFEPSFSPDGTLIAFASQRQGHQAGIYVIPALSGEERQIAPRGRRPRFSPDGEWIAFWDAQKVYVVRSAGGLPTAVAPEFLIASYPSWFPDSKRLMFVGNRDSPGSYWDDWFVASIDGGPIRGMGAQAIIERHGLRGPYGRILVGILPELSPAGDAVLFSATAEASTNLWRMRIAPDTGQLSGPPEQLTFLASEPGLSLQPSPALSGDVLRIAFWNVTANTDVWSVALAADEGRPLGPPRRLTRNAAVEQWASLSGDGRRMAYNVRRGLNWDTWVMDLESGRQTPLAVGPLPELWPKITRDGSKVAYAVEDGKTQEIRIHTLGVTVPEKVCEGCTEPWDWSSDGQHLLYRTGIPRKIGSVGPSGTARVVLEHPEHNLHVPRFSPDDRWVAFAAHPAAIGAGAILFVAPFRADEPIPLAEWRVISESADANNSPVGWSPDGSLIYFMSERDGSRCLWAQRVDPMTKQPRGAPFEVQPFHHPQVRSMPLWQPGAAGTALGGHTFIFSMAEASGSIWMAHVK
jgi:eukaryotic-like serine/threonine-protein kinase